MFKCPFAYRKPGDASLHCTNLDGFKATQCAQQYFCPGTKKWENTDAARKCKIRKIK